jgi:coenzyme F420-reducing hydrogenase delta subunit
MRLEYPANIKIIRVPCSGKVDVMHLLRAIQKGADGVYVVGCLEGTCHYNEGNLRARERVAHVRDLLEEIGIEGDRVRMYNLSSGEGPTFAAYAKEMTEHIKELGPNPLKSADKKIKKEAA